ncbi:transcriptional regulator [Methylobacterium sp. J-068]|uniref:transcriptional regulator n=1 Tax=Methylobacterium sp. J-068 TaxID=2836649 RepID=UPI001FBB44B7|nr:transcriptional regulator [Methylobacterium sp. J-068]MCJ2033176.1 transcriptional regulator [Methylobacterium sp. J-068]
MSGIGEGSGESNCPEETGARLPSTRQLSAETHPHLAAFVDFLPELNRESDRGQSLVACSYLDDLLKRTLSAHFANQEVGLKLVEGFNAPLGTFSTRIAAAFALGLVTEREYRELETLRRIRNRFAHEVHVSFETNAVRDLCGNLSMAAPNYGDIVVDARGQHSTAACGLILTLTNRPEYVRRARRSPQVWPY